MAAAAAGMPEPSGLPQELSPEDMVEPRGARGRPRQVQETPMTVDLEGKGPDKRPPESDTPELARSRKNKKKGGRSPEQLLMLEGESKTRTQRNEERKALLALTRGDTVDPGAIDDAPRKKSIMDSSK